MTLVKTILSVYSGVINLSVSKQMCLGELAHLTQFSVCREKNISWDH